MGGVRGNPNMGGGLFNDRNQDVISRKLEAEWDGVIKSDRAAERGILATGSGDKGHNGGD